MDLVLDYENYAKVARQAAAEGIVLLENKEKALPLDLGSKLAVLGRTQFDTVYCGMGSGGSVNVPYVVSITEGLEQDFKLHEKLRTTYENWLLDNPFDRGDGWGQTPCSQKEMPISDKLMQEAADFAETAIVVIGRSAGEDKDSVAEKGGYYLNDEELLILKSARTKFKKVIVLLNTGNILDMNWVDEIQPDAVLYIWQGGCESGNAVADVISGRVNPSGKLPDTIVKNLDDIIANSSFGEKDKIFYNEDIYVGYRYFETFFKEQVAYPFAYGLSYTSFAQEIISVNLENDTITVKAKITNTGDLSGKTAWQIYFEAPQGELGKPSRALIDFGKTEIMEPSTSVEILQSIHVADLASFDDSGASGFVNAYVLESGEYNLYMGFDVRNAERIFSWTITEVRVVEQLTEALAPQDRFSRIKAKRNAEGNFVVIVEDVPLAKNDLNTRIAERPLIDESYTVASSFQDYLDGKVTLDEYVRQFSNDDLICLSRGNGMSPSGVTAGVAGAIGAVSKNLRKSEMPLLALADGPSGVRMDNGSMAFSVANGTCLAATFDTNLNRELFEFVALELRKNNISSLLGPGMNIHRHPLNGRNFEYFSEDPYLTGMIARAQVEAMYKYHISATVKHFALNSQEFARHDSSSVVSQRAAREIYLKPFEIVVKSGILGTLMTSYNRINGIWAASNFDLNTTILRDEWGYSGLVMTDWWAKCNWAYGEEGSSKFVGAMVRAQNDVYMVTMDSETNAFGDLATEELEAGKYHRSDLIRNAKNICEFLRKYDLSMLSDNVIVKNEPQFRDKVTSVIDLALVEDEAEIKLSEHSTARGHAILIEFVAAKPANYSMILNMSKVGLEGAQLNVSVSQNKRFTKVITLKGSESISEKFVFSCFEAPNNFIEIYFSESGLKLEDTKLVME